MSARRTEAQLLVRAAADRHAKVWERGGRRKREKWPADAETRAKLETYFARDLAYQFALRGAERYASEIEIAPTDTFGAALAAQGYAMAADIVLDRLSRFSGAYEGKPETVEGRPRLEWALWYAFLRQRGPLEEAFAPMVGAPLAPDVAPAVREVRS